MGRFTRLYGPVDRRVVTRGGVSPVIEGRQLFAYGNSQCAYTANADLIYFDRVKARMRMPGNSAAGQGYWANFGIGGSLVSDMCAYAYGTATIARQYTLAYSSITAVGGGTWANAARLNGIVLLDTIGNDAGLDGFTASGGTTAKSRASYTNGLDALIRLLRATSRTEDTAFTLSAGWNTVASTSASAGGLKWTSTVGATATIASIFGTDFDLIVMGLDDAALGQVACQAVEVRVDGALVATVDLRSQHRKTTYTGHPAIGQAGFCQYAIPLRGLSAANHSIEVKHNGAAGQILYLDCLLVASATPPTLILLKKQQFGAAGYATFNAIANNAGASWATDQVYNGLLDTVVARFPNDGSIQVIDPNIYGWNAATMIGNIDGASVHLNDRGNAYYADLIMDRLNALPYRDGLGRL